MRIYIMHRGGKDVAEVVTLESGKCVVSWPSSVIVYDSEDAARAVHIDHMGGRGAVTEFRLIGDTSVQHRGAVDAYQDRCEGIPFASVGGNIPLKVPEYIGVKNAEDYMSGYIGQCVRMFGVESIES